MKIISIVGARPQFIKAAMVSLAGSRVDSVGYREIIVHTGQHYEDLLSGVFFRELGLSAPEYNLGIGSGSHGTQTGRMLEGLEEILINESPHCVMVYGDTNTTLAGALAAVKLGVPLAHVEAGLRSYNRAMPEEHNRVLTDHCSDLLLCPTPNAVERLRAEGITAGVHAVGDVMFDVLNASLEIAANRSKILETLKLERGDYILATVHRSYNTDDPRRLEKVVEELSSLNADVILPMHPRTRDAIAKNDINIRGKNIRTIEPVSYFDMLVLEENARVILTDSGGVQKEAYMLGVPCITLRTETEWVETVETGWNRLLNVDSESVKNAVEAFTDVPSKRPPLFGDGNASARIVDHILSEFAVR